ncbi:hypothetical protein GRX03_16255 [Halovenus sp. WSH3]|uniref:DUF7978 domain-containing protein n=1 Tax=Halovenus carboxidivorans TaxID=2692199 RepID=A0A6B0T880_9EURY|nr:hypothetical protein [Halovenus carboxidivorans]MXR53147.1 hypothetical protein [Halovenus carboxidivorans]
MSVRSGPGNSAVARGAFAGAVAYLLGLGVIAAAEFTGLHPSGGVWARTSGGVGHLFVHMVAHLPVWEFTVQWTMLPYTGLFAVFLLAAGFAVGTASDTDADAFRVGRAVVVGYAPLTLAASIALVLSGGAITAVRMVAPTVLVGVFVPALFGGLGAVAAARVAPTAAGEP